MYIAVVSPPVEDFYFTPHRASALGARTVCSIIETYGPTARLFHFPGSGEEEQLPLPLELSYLRPYLLEGETGPVSFFTAYKRFGPSYKKCAEIILETEPDAVFLSCFAWAYAQNTISLAESLKQRNPNLPIAAGGAGASVFPEYFLQSEGIDFVLSGEGESSIPVFLDWFRGTDTTAEAVPNLFLKTGGEPSRSAAPGQEIHPQADELVFTWALTGETKKRYFISGAATRGCPKKCSFCSIHLIHGPQYRKTPLYNIERTFGSLPEDKPITFNFEDDNLFSDTEYALALLGMIKRRFPSCSFTAENGIDYTLIDRELLEELISLGFFRFNFSLGVMDAGQSKRQHRRVSTEKLEASLAYLYRREIPAAVYFICGLSGDSPDSLLQTLLYMHSLPSRTGISLFYPVPGLPGFQDRAVFTEKSPRLSAGSSAYPWNRSLTTRQLVTAFRLARYSNFLKEKLNDPRYRSLRDTAETAGALHTLVRKNGGTSIVPVPELDEELVHAFQHALLQA